MEFARPSRAVADGTSLALVCEYEHEAAEGTRAGAVGAYACARSEDGNGVDMRRVGGVGDEPSNGDAIGAVFEARWSARVGEETSRCAFVDASGFLTTCDVDVVEDEGADAPAIAATLEVKYKVQCGGGGLGMATCLDWRSDGAMLTSASDGSFRVSREDGARVEVVDVVEGAHDLEMWAIAFDIARNDVAYTGADDCAFKVWDLRDASRARHTNRKTHGAGVTCVSPSPRDENIIATGSYDDHVRLWDVRSLKNPVSELNVGGGVWRCRWHPTRDALACAAMGGGAVLCDATGGALVQTFAYDEHDSIVYGADWARLSDDPDRESVDVLVTCSFYDKCVRCWSLV